MSDPTTPVQCALHSETPATFVCRHLRFGVACGFHCSSEDADDPWPDAWCDLCQGAFEREGEWTESNEPEISLVCTGCYEIARAKNQRVPQPLLPNQLALTAEQYAAFAHAAYERCKMRQEAARLAWPLLGTGKRWHYDSERRMIRFFDEPREVAVVADVTIAGSYSNRSHTWMWVWGNDEYSRAERALVAPLRTFGEVRGIEKFTQATWSGQEVDAWEVAQIAADLLGSAAVYRAPIDHSLVFMLLSNLRSVHLT
ncbi:MAG: hypothetical protein QM756_36430 [Polyangiaceae bacterium]